jgi:NADH-quinone oxidoreductase subunit A
LEFFVDEIIAMLPLAAGGTLTPWDPGLPALFLYCLMILALMGFLLFLSSWLGEKKITANKALPFECGIIPTGPAQVNYPVPFYRVAVFFLLFDVEAAFIFAWAVAFLELGWSGWLQISFFIILLLAGLFYIGKKKGLDWVFGFETPRPDQK